MQDLRILRFLSWPSAVAAVVALIVQPAPGRTQSQTVEIRRPALDAVSKIHGEWTSFVNTNHVRGLAVDGDYVWTVGGGVKRYNLRTNSYTLFYTEHGIASNDTRGVAVEEDFVWVVTAAGVSRYSKQSKKWRNFYKEDGLADNVIVSLAIDQRHKTIWFGTWDSGVTGYDARNDQWQSYTTEDGLSGNCVISLALDPRENTLLCGTWGKGVSELNLRTGSWNVWDQTSKLPSKTITALAVDEDAVWLGTLSAGIWRFGKKRNTLECFTNRNGSGANEISAIAVDKASDSVWVGSRDGGLSRFRKDLGRWETRMGEDGLLTNISAIGIGDGRQLLLGSWGNGLIIYDYGSKGVQIFKTENEVVYNQVVTIFAERTRDQLWFGTEGGGASSYDLRTDRWQDFRKEMMILSDNTVNEIAVGFDNVGKNHIVWFGTLDGMTGIAGSRRPHKTESAGLRVLIKGALIESFAVDQKGKTLWVGTNNQGLYRCGLMSGKCRHVDELADYVYFSLAWDDSEGRLWCGTKTGIVSYDAVRREKVTSGSAPAGMTEVRAVLLDHERNALWAGSWFSGLFRYEKTTGQWTQYTEADGLPGETVAALAIDSRKEGRAALWVGTNRGAAKYDFSSGQWQQFNTKDGLAHNFVLAVAVDNGGSVWFGTWGGGVSKYD